MCPHGHNSNPDSCSSCLGVFVKRVTFSDDGTRTLLFNGHPDPALMEKRAKSRVGGPTPYVAEGVRKCTKCRKTGHRANSCQAAPEEQQEAYETEDLSPPELSEEMRNG